MPCTAVVPDIGIETRGIPQEEHKNGTATKGNIIVATMPIASSKVHGGTSSLESSM